MGVKLKESVDRYGMHYAWLFHCPGCEMPHSFTNSWQFDGDVIRPTVSPSILVTWNYGEPPEQRRCHSFVRAGRIEFLPDCTHALRGKTVDLPDWELW